MTKEIKVSKKPDHATQEERERVIKIYKRAQKMFTAKNYYSQNWVEYERIWKLFEDQRTGEDSWRATLPDTWIYATIKTAQAVFIDSRVVPIFSQHEKEDLLKHKDLSDLYKDIADKGDLDLELYYARLDAFRFGMGFLETVYVEDKRTVHMIEEFDPETGEITYKKDEIKDFDDPKTVRISPWFMLVDDMARADFANTARDCIKIEVLEYDQAKEKYGHLISNWDERVKKASVFHTFLSEVQKINVAQTADTNTKFPAFKEFRFFAPIKLGGDNVEILHYWNKFEDTYEIVANGEPLRVKTKKEPSPIPYIHKQLPFTPIPYSSYSGDEFWAAGIIEIGRSEAKSIKQFREMTIDRQRLHLFSPVFSDVNDEIDQKQFRLKPLSVIRTQGGVPKQFQIPGASNADFELQDRMEDSFKRVTGVDERTLGVSGSPKITATEMQFLRDAAMRRLRDFAFLYRKALLREVKLKIKLFDQYYSSPFKADEHVRNDGIKQIKVKAKQFKVKISDNVYTKKDVNPRFFEGDIDVDIDMQVLLPMTPAQQVTKWAQVLRDIFPFVQAGVVKLDMEKVITKYLDALEVNINTLRQDKDEQAIIMAEGEHRLFSNKNTSKVTLEEILPEGTPLEVLNAAHIQHHQVLMKNDDKIEETELLNLAKHIAKDVENFQKLSQQQQGQAQQINPQSLNQVGGIVPQMIAQTPQQEEQIPQSIKT